MKISTKYFHKSISYCADKSNKPTYQQCLPPLPPDAPSLISLFLLFSFMQSCLLSHQASLSKVSASSHQLLVRNLCHTQANCPLSHMRACIVCTAPCSPPPSSRPWCSPFVSRSC